MNRESVIPLAQNPRCHVLPSQCCCRPAVAAARPSMPARKSMAPAAASAWPAGTPKAVTFAAKSAAKGPASHRLSMGGMGGTPRAAAAAVAAAADPEPLSAEDDGELLGADGGFDPAVESEPMLEDGSAAGVVEAAALTVVAQREEHQHAEPAGAAAHQEGHTPRGGEAAPAGQPGGSDAPGKTPWRTPAPVFNEAKTPATAGPATGWQLMYQQEEEEGPACAGMGRTVSWPVGDTQAQPAHLLGASHAGI